MPDNKVLLIVRDGWGNAPKTKGNAIAAANTPFDDYLNSQNNNKVLLETCGPAVGLPEGFQGSSEVGHMSMGAGRIIKQEVTRINAMFEDGEFYKSDKFYEMLTRLKSASANIHLMGLLQNEGVHAHQQQLFYLLSYFKQVLPDRKVFVHVFSDGRDTAPQSVCGFLDELESQLKKHGNAAIATLVGRYYAMDRARNWKLTSITYDAICFAKGLPVSNIYTAIEQQYEKNKTPDKLPMFDEYLPPFILNEYQGVRPQDVLINFNYRQDRAIQLSQAFVEPSCTIYHDFNKNLHYYGLTKYYDQFRNFLVSEIITSNGSSALVGKVISDAGLRQLRMAETQKFRHVTSFFNGKLTNPFPQEERIEIPSEYDPSAFATHPEMNAREVTAALLEKLTDDYAFILVNYANCDMVGHTGNFNAAVKACEIVDKNVETVSKHAIKRGYSVIITADHGNSDEMLYLDSGKIKTSHTLNPVKLHLLNSNATIKPVQSKGVLSNVGTLILSLLNLPIPREMTCLNMEILRN